MRRFLAVAGLLVSLGGLGVLGWWAWPLVFPQEGTSWASSLSKVDAALLRNDGVTARAILSDLPRTMPVSGWLQWEKRAVQVATESKDWSWASGIGENGHKAYPGNLELSATWVWMLLRANRAADAVAQARIYLAGTKWDGLRVQAEVESLGLAQGDWQNLRERLSEPSADLVPLLESLARIQTDPSLEADALLAGLLGGDWDTARRHLNSLAPLVRDRPPFDRLQAYMAYDQGDWGRAAALLKSVSATDGPSLLILADVYLHLGNPEQAAIIYDQLLADPSVDHGLSVVVNRSRLFLDSGDATSALELIRRIRTQNNGRLGEPLLRLEWQARFELGDRQSVLHEIDDRLKQTSNDNSQQLADELLLGELSPDMVSVPRLWTLLHDHPDSGLVAERLAWILLEQQDYPSALRVIDLYSSGISRDQISEPWWIPFYRGLILACSGDLAGAERSFGQVSEAWKSASFWADWSLVAKAAADHGSSDDRQVRLSNAQDRITKAIDLLPPAMSHDALTQRSRWLSLRAEIQLSLVPFTIPAQRGSLQSMVTEDLRQAVHLDPDNLKASFLLRQVLGAAKESL